MMKSADTIIVKPVITERSMDGVANKRYTFEVMDSATKPEIAHAVEEMFGVKVKSVNTINVYDILNCDTFIVAKAAVEKIEEVYAK